MLLAMVALNIIDTFVQAIDRHWEVMDKVSIAEYEKKYGKFEEEDGDKNLNKNKNEEKDERKEKN